jgi:hypothetical protein
MSRSVRYETVATRVDRVCSSLLDQADQVKWQLKEKTKGRVRRVVDDEWGQFGARQLE